MADLANLGFNVDTRQLKEGKAALEALGPAGSKAQKAADGVASSIEQAGKSAKRATQSLDSASSATARLSSTAGSAATATGRIAQAANQNRDAFNKASKAANDNAAAVSRAGNAAGKAANDIGGLNRSAGLAGAALSGMAKGALAAAAAAVSIGAIVEAGRGVIETTKSFQTLKASLETVIGSAEKAGQAFEFAKQFAKTTPFDLAQVTEAIIKLKALGLAPTEEALTSFGNTASAMGKPLMQFIEAVADAATGEFERLKEFGIKASQDGDKVALTFQGVTKTIGNNATEIQKYLVDIGKTNFAGGMDKQSKLLGGSLAAAGDSIEQFKNAIGEGGLAAAVQTVVDNTANWFAANQDLAASIGSVAGVAVTGLATAFDYVTTAIGESYKWITATVQVVSELASGFMTGGQQIVAAGEGMVSVATTFNQSWMATGKIIYDVINGIIGAFVSAYRVISNRWEQLPTLFKSVAAAAANALINGIQNAVNGAISGINNLINSVNQIAPSFAQLGNIGTANLQGFTIAVDDAGQAALESAESITQQAMATDYLGAGLDSVVGVVSDFGGRIADAKTKIDLAADASKNLGAATGKIALPDLSGPKQAIEEGITKPSKEAAKALREAEAAKKRLLGEADAAVEKFFPFEAAAVEAERLTAAINDTSNGLTDLQRNALRRQIDQNFIDAQDAVDNFEKKTNKSVKNIGKTINEEIAESLSDAFTDALSSSDGFFKSLLSSFAGLGRQLTQNGFDSIFGNLMGTAKQSGGSNLAALGSSLSGAARSSGAATIAKIDAGDFARASGQMLQYSSRFNSNVDARLTKILQTAASRFDMPVTAISGLRPGDSRYHGKGLATDVQITGADGKALGNYQDASTFRTYERFAQLSKQVQSELFPELEGMLRWGGYFGGAKGKYGALDTMHFDLAGDKTGMGGGSWAEGLTSAMRKLWPGADSQGLTKAVQKGVQAGIDPWQGLRTVSPGATAGGAKTGGLTGGQKAFGALSAGLGIFSQGMESQSPLMGAVSGALGGFSAGAAMGAGLGPIGAVLGGVVGAVGGLFGKKKAKKAAQKQKWEQAEANWQQNYSQFQTFEDEVGRTERGPLSSKIREMQSALSQFDKLAKAAKGDNHNDEIRRARAKMESYIEFLNNNFKSDLDKVIGDLGKGLGTDTTFTKARDNVMTLGDSYRGLLTDIQTAYAVPVDQRSAILAQFDAAKKTTSEVTKRIESLRTDSRGNVYRSYKTEVTQKDDPKALASAVAKRDADLAAFDAKYGQALAEMNAKLAAAENAAVEGLLRIVSGDTVNQSDVEKALDESQGAAAGLRVTLVDLGKSAEETGVLIEQALAKRLESLRKDFVETLSESIEAFDGKDYLADFRDLFEQLSSLGKDSSLLGLDGSLVNEYFKKSAQEIVNDAALTGDAFNDLITAFPQLQGVVERFVESAEDKANRLADYADRVFAANNDSSTLSGALAAFDRSAAKERFESIKQYGTVAVELDKALSAERIQIARDYTKQAESALLEAYNSQVDALQNFVDSIGDFLTSLKTDSSLSNLDAQGRLKATEAEYLKTLALAQGGDVDAQGKLVSVSEAYLNEAKSFYATSEEYYKVYDQVVAQLTSAQTTAVAQKDLLTQQVSSLISIDNGVKTVAEAIEALREARATEKNAGRSYGLNPERNKLIDAGVKSLGLSFTGNYGVTNGVDEFLQWRMKLPASQLSAVDAVINKYIGINRASGGLITGPGTATSDSISVNASNGEFMMRASAVESLGVRSMSYINETGRLPPQEQIGVGIMPNGANANNDEKLAEISRQVARVAQAVIASGVEIVNSNQETNRGLNKLREDIRLAS